MAFDVPVPLAEAVPWEAGLEMLQVRVSERLRSVALSVKAKAVGLLSSSTVTAAVAPSVITGASLTTRGVTVMVTVAMFVNTPSASA